MKTPISALLLSAFVLSGCASKFNPLNWFKRDTESETLAPLEDPNVIIDQRGMVDQVISLQIEKTGGGAIIHAVGLSPTQGFWDAELIPENGERPVNGVLSYQFRIERPPGVEGIVNQRSREIVVGHFVSSFKLRGVSQIRVIGARTALVSKP